MYFPEAATFYLYDPSGWRGSINIGKAYDPAGLVTVQPNGLIKALDALADLAIENGRRPHLEVHCHGQAAVLELGQSRAVSMDNVALVGRQLSKVLRPGGLIELLACEVAAQDGEGNLLSAETHLIRGYEPDYHGALRLRKKVRYQRDPGNGDMRNLQIYGRRSIPRENEIATVKGQGFVPRPASDGLAFCRKLAAESQCIVRAAATSQAEDDEKGSSPIGNWENEIFDFHPGGKVVFKGSSPYRGPMMDSFDVGRNTA